MTVLRLSFPLRVEPLPFRRGTCAVPSRLVTQDESRHEKDRKRCFLPAFSHFQNDKVFGFFYSIAVTNAFLLSSVSSRRCMLSGCCGKTAKLRPMRSQAAPGGPASSGRRRRGSQRSRCPEDVGPGLGVVSLLHSRRYSRAGRFTDPASRRGFQVVQTGI